MNKKIIGFLISILLITTIFTASGIDNSERFDVVIHQNELYHTVKEFIVGLIKDMQSENITSFTEILVLHIFLEDYNGTKMGGMGISMKTETKFDMRLHQFKGLLLKHFICGVVNYPKVTVSPSAIPYAEPAELEIFVTKNDVGVSGVLVNISIPGISGEMSTHTDPNGLSLFAFTPPTTGNITIEIENQIIYPLKVRVYSPKQ
jgi:hypothetical protein